MKQRTYIAIDLKSFYASVECRERGLDPLDTNLVVADESRTDKTICLAVTPSLKSYGIGAVIRIDEGVVVISFGLRRVQLTLKSLHTILFQNQRLSKLYNDRRFLLNAFQKGVRHVAAGLADHGDDIMCDPAFEGFGFGLTAAQNKRVKSRFVHHRHVGIASFITLI